MDGETSIGPDEGKPAAAGADKSDQAIVEGVDAQEANELDMRRGLAGAEAKPFAEPPSPASAKAKQSERGDRDSAQSPKPKP